MGTCTSLCGEDIEWELPSAFGGQEPHSLKGKAQTNHRRDKYGNGHTGAAYGQQQFPYAHSAPSSTRQLHPAYNNGHTDRNGGRGGGGGGVAHQQRHTRRRSEPEVLVAECSSSRSESQKPYKLLLLGSGESGKSTIFKRTTLEYGDGYENSERKAFISSIHENTIETMITLVRESQMSEEESWQIEPAFRDSAKEMLELDESDTLVLSKNVATHVQRLWCDEGIREVFEHRSDFQIPDGASYFLEDVHRLARPGYLPSDSDILRCRDRTVGINSETFTLPGSATSLGGRSGKGSLKIELFDLGGQRCERRHWKKAFQDVSAIIFVVAISEFDMKLFEDGEVNRLEESLEVFKLMSGNKRLKSVPFVLFFNKMDLFIDKIESGVVFDYAEYEGPQKPTAIRRFVKELFEENCESEVRPVCIFGSAIDEEEFCPDHLMLTAIEM